MNSLWNMKARKDCTRAQTGYNNTYYSSAAASQRGFVRLKYGALMKTKEKLSSTLSQAILFSALMLIWGCANHISGEAPKQFGPATNGTSLQNGVYAVLNKASTPDQAKVNGIVNVILPYDQNKYSDVVYNEPRIYVAIDPNSYVPIVFEKAPQVQKDGRGKSVLSVSLKQENAKMLEDFTRAHLGGLVATVVDGEIISLNKIRAVITGGQLQMTRCTDNACEIIRAKLVK
jgi:preprotein translocase subunit SecD